MTTVVYGSVDQSRIRDEYCGRVHCNTKNAAFARVPISTATYEISCHMELSNCTFHTFTTTHYLIL